MHIALLSDIETTGGAAVAASHLARGLVNAGHEITRIVCIRENGDSGHGSQTRHLQTFPGEGHLRRRIIHLPSRLRVRTEAIINGRARDKLSVMLNELQPEVINVHNLHAVRWDPRIVETCAEAAPTIWTLHDMWSFTGRCAYSYDCYKFIQGCDASCPTPHESPRLEPDRIAGAWEARRAMFNDYPDLVAVTPSRWLATEAKRGLWRNHRVEVIPNGIPLDTLKPSNQEVARRALGLPLDAPVIMITPGAAVERRKGSDLIDGILRRLETRPMIALSYGRGALPKPPEGLKMKSLGHVDEQTKAMAFAAADLYVHPAPVDNLPNTVLESTACGTPCIAFDVGGLADIVRPAKTGWLVPELDSGAMAAMVDRALAYVKRDNSMRDTCREFAEREFGVARMADRYTALFSALANDQKTTDGIHR